MISCAAKACDDPPCTLIAVSYPEGKEWRFCLRHFWRGVHILLNRGDERVIVKYPNGVDYTPTKEGSVLIKEPQPQ